jgi:transcription termination factor Rho
LDVVADGIGFLRHGDLLPSPDDIYVSQSQIRRLACELGIPLSARCVRPRRTRNISGCSE